MKSLKGIWWNGTIIQKRSQTGYFDLMVIYIEVITEPMGANETCHVQSGKKRMKDGAFGDGHS